MRERKSLGFVAQLMPAGLQDGEFNLTFNP
jgi:hypothetical protein